MGHSEPLFRLFRSFQAILKTKTVVNFSGIQPWIDGVQG